MRREGLLYGLVFLGIVAAGTAWILPRVLGGAGARGPYGSRPSPPAEAPPPPEAAPTETPPPAPPAWRTVRVTGPGQPLRGPLKPVLGAEVEGDVAVGDPSPRLRLRPVAPVVFFGAGGHRWVGLPAEALVDGGDVALPLAADPIVVRVREADGGAAPDVPVRLRPEPPDGERRTDAGGTLVVDDAMPGVLEIEVGGSERTGPTLRVATATTREVRAELEPGWHVRGRAVGPDGGPAASALVEGVGPAGRVGRRTVSGPDGRFEWVGPVTRPFALRIEAPDGAGTTVEAVPPATPPLETSVGDLVLTAGGVVEIRVRAEEVAPDATAALEPAAAAPLRELFGPAAALDLPRVLPIPPDGRLRFEGVPTDLPLRLTLRGAGLAVDEIGTVPAGKTWTLEAGVPTGLALEGRVTDGPGGMVRAGLVVLASRHPVDGDLEVPGDRKAVTDAAGRFSFRGLPRGFVFLRAYAPGRRSLLRRVDPAATPQVVLTLEPAILDAERRLEGTVVDPEGRPLAGVTVRAAGVVATTDGQGRFRLEGVESLAPRVVVAAGFEPGPAAPGVDPRGFAPVVRQEAAPGGPPLTLVLPTTGALAMRILDGITDEPIASLRVLIQGDGGQILLDRDVATVDGRVRWEGLASRAVRVTLLAASRRQSLQTGLEPGTVKDLGDVRLAHGVRVRGRVEDEKGRPVEGAHVAALDEGWLRAREGDPVPLREIPLRTTRSSSDGTYVLEGLDPLTPFAVGAWAAGRAPVVGRVPPEELRRGPEAHLDLKLRPGGHLIVHLQEVGSGRRISGALPDLEDARTGANHLDLVHRVILEGAAGSPEDWREASRQLLPEREAPGRYLLGPVEPGPYRLLVDHPLYRPERRNLTVLPPGEAVVGLQTAELAAEAPGTMSLLVEMEPAPER